MAFHKRPDYNLVKHLLIPGFGLIANLVCMGFYLAGPIFGLGTFKEPLLALGISAVWGIYGAIYFLRSSKAKGKAVLLDVKIANFCNTLTQPQPLGGISPLSLQRDEERRTTQWSF